MGGVILADEIPKFCQQLILYFQQKEASHGAYNPSILYTVIAGIKVVIGFILIIYQRHIVNFIDYKRKK